MASTKMSFTLVFLLYASHTHLGFSECEESDTSESTECSTEDYSNRIRDNETCFIDALNTTGHPVPVGCTLDCGNFTRYLPNGTECIDLTQQASDVMQSDVSYYCPIGLCMNGICKRSGLELDCWHDTPPPVSTDTTIENPTTSISSSASL
uniref:Evasin n=1 Tax=Amblyomma maculatum TaxID=34609 RepID=G3MSY6_AMBMU